MVTAAQRVAKVFWSDCDRRDAVDHAQPRVSCAGSSGRHCVLRHVGFGVDPPNAHGCCAGLAQLHDNPEETFPVGVDPQPGLAIFDGECDVRDRKRSLRVS